MKIFFLKLIAVFCVTFIKKIIDLKRGLLLFFLLLFVRNSSAQEMHLTISGASALENKSIDSIQYNKIHLNAKSVTDEANNLSKKLIAAGFLETEILSQKKENDSSFQFQFSLGKKINFIHIYIGRTNKLKSLTLFDSSKDTLIIPFKEIERFMKTTLTKLEIKGFALAKLKLINIKRKQNVLITELSLILENKRDLNDIVIKGYDKFPLGYKLSLQKKYKNQIFNQDNLRKIHDDFNKIRFVKQTKYPEILFTKDSTKVYVYLEKAKTNTFDGYIGFSNDENKKVILNGYLDLALNNAINIGEKISVFWKSDGKEQKTFNINLELPYVFKSPLGIKTQLNIFKQDSTFQNTKTALDLGYFFNYNSKLYIGYQATESSDIQNQNNATISDYTNSYLTTTFEYSNFETEDALFPEKTNLNIKFGFGKRDMKTQNNKQLFTTLSFKHHYYFNPKNAFTIRTQSSFLKSSAYIINELYRFGGENSVRGFAENSFQASFMASIQTEYRYKVSPSLYVNSILDFGYYQDKTSKINNNLSGIGLGFALLTKNGLLHINYVNGIINNQAIKMSDSIIYLNFKTLF